MAANACDTVPTEVLVLIFSYIPTQVLLRTVALVCKKFDDILKSEWYWKARHSPYVKHFPVEFEDVRQRQLACAQFDVLTAGGSRDPKENSFTLRGNRRTTYMRYVCVCVCVGVGVCVDVGVWVLCLYIASVIVMEEAVTCNGKH